MSSRWKKPHFGTFKDHLEGGGARTFGVLSAELGERGKGVVRNCAVGKRVRGAAGAPPSHNPHCEVEVHVELGGEFGGFAEKQAVWEGVWDARPAEGLQGSLLGLENRWAKEIQVGGGIFKGAAEVAKWFVGAALYRSRRRW